MYGFEGWTVICCFSKIGKYSRLLDFEIEPVNRFFGSRENARNQPGSALKLSQTIFTHFTCLSHAPTFIRNLFVSRGGKSRKACVPIIIWYIMLIQGLRKQAEIVQHQQALQLCPTLTLLKFGHIISLHLTCDHMKRDTMRSMYTV